MYEYTIHCLACGYVKAQGGLHAPAILANDQVVELAEHNPGCMLAQAPASSIHIESRADSENSNVTCYILILSRS